MKRDEVGMDVHGQAGRLSAKNGDGIDACEAAGTHVAFFQFISAPDCVCVC